MSRLFYIIYLYTMPTAGIAPYNMIALVNKSSLMNDTDGATIVAALNSMLPIFCNDWNIPPVVATYVKRGASTTIPLQCLVLDTSDANGAFGYNNESNGISYAKVFVKSILQYGGVILYNANPAVPTVAASVSHVVFEMIADLRANVWWGCADGYTLIAAEVCDPVEGNIVAVKPRGLPTVGLSDWVLPAWADPQAKLGPYNHNNTLKAPMTAEKGGYLITMANSVYTPVLGSDV
jgi:hypothetical protein